MHLRNIFCLAASTLVCSIGVFTDAAIAQEWRGGEIRRFEKEAHRFGERCMYRVEAKGFADQKFFGGGGSKKAELRAIEHWESEISKAFGPQYASWARAQGKSAGCAPKGIAELECVVVANPCRER